MRKLRNISFYVDAASLNFRILRSHKGCTYLKVCWTKVYLSWKSLIFRRPVKIPLLEVNFSLSFPLWRLVTLDAYCIPVLHCPWIVLYVILFILEQDVKFVLEFPNIIELFSDFTVKNLIVHHVCIFYFYEEFKCRIHSMYS